ncbi:MAG: hypothetical protein ACRDWD_01350, partial [Acidimicrobiia bacterium]
RRAPGVVSSHRPRLDVRRAMDDQAGTSRTAGHARPGQRGGGGGLVVVAGVAAAVCCAVPVLAAAGFFAALTGIALGGWLLITAGLLVVTAALFRWRHRSRRGP